MSKFSQLVQKQKEAKQIKKQHFNLEAKTNANRGASLCACGSLKSYASCCKPIHQNIYKAKTPLSLMRSRYVAYVYANIDFLMLSHHTSTCPIKEKDEILAWTKAVEWLGLEIVEESPLIDEAEGFITFKAAFKENGVESVIYEKSRFLKENNHWVYVDGSHY